MTETVAYCGLMCQTCPIYLATRQENREEQARMKAEVVRLCQEHYGISYNLEDITDCDGCRTESGRLFSASRNCLIRKCATKRGLENCAHCAEYACNQLETIFRTDPSSKARLDEIRRGIP